MLFDVIVQEKQEVYAEKLKSAVAQICHYDLFYFDSIAFSQ